MDQLLNDLKQFAETETDVPLSTMTTLRIGGRAEYTVYPETEIALDGIVRMIRKVGIPFKIFGKGSNILCSDADYNGVIIRLDRHFNEFYFKDETVTAQAGCSIITLSYEAMKKGLSGLEFANGIPATVGGVSYMNAGAYKCSMSDIIDSLFIYRDEKFEWIPASECGYAYRTSVFQQHPDWIILAVRMHLEKKDSAEIYDRMNDRRQRRLSTQPLDFPSCGSVFRNPENMNAWKLIDGIGYRGRKLGGAMVSDKHPNFIINSNHASGSDFLTLCSEIQQKVYEKYGIHLHMEVEKFNWL